MENEINTIGKKFTMPELIKFVAPPVTAKLFMSLLSTIDDSLFISRYCGENALAAFTIGLPWFMLMDAFVMVLCAVSSKCSMLMGEKKNEKANSSFTTMVIVAFLLGCCSSTVLFFFKKPILRLLGATDVLLPIITRYMSISQFYIPLVYVTNMFARFYTVSGKPKMGVIASVIQISCNLFFDWLLIAKKGIGIIGAAYGNLAGFVLLTILGLFFYSNKNNEIHFSKLLDKQETKKLISDVWRLGRSQGLTSIAISFNSFITNKILLANGGETLVAGYTVVNNVQFMFMQAFFGFIGSISPIASYAYGEKNQDKLSNIIKKSTILIECLSLLVGVFIALCKKPIIYLYFGDSGNQVIRDMANYGLNVSPFCYGIFSFNILVQELLIAVGNHKTSAFLSVLENIVFSNIVTIVLPILFKEHGIWYLFLVSEALTLVFTLIVVYINKDKYGYGKDNVATFINE